MRKLLFKCHPPVLEMAGAAATCQQLGSFLHTAVPLPQAPPFPRPPEDGAVVLSVPLPE